MFGVVYSVGSNGGKFRVIVDGVEYPVVNTYSSSEVRYKQEAIITSELEDKEHTAIIEHADSDTRSVAIEGVMINGLHES